MIGKGSAGFRLRWTQQHHNPGSRRRCLRVPVRCSYDLTAQYTVLGLTPLASKSDVKRAYKRLALKYHPDVYKGEDVPGKDKAFREIKSAYECLLQNLKLKEDESRTVKVFDEFDEWDEWMGFEGGIPVIPTEYNTY
ncbi:hypothetical protein SLEP1_g43534 [Rubroshorea leprosula]|uniref:J domain-containing protein n=1 Tax=Rubroshorea leprosula TaxID=152421 RepID=A0AAV5LDA3_9ROSI|nr:hypothetical protein SLEP1_g43534 [Rubroshorea leprosula]